jgi:hypothetical protein
MAKDYKHRTQNKNTASYRQKSETLSLWRWMLITALIISFVVFLVYLRGTGPKPVAPQQPIPTQPEPAKNEAPAEEKKRRKSLRNR